MCKMRDSGVTKYGHIGGIQGSSWLEWIIPATGHIRFVSVSHFAFAPLHQFVVFSFDDAVLMYFIERGFRLLEFGGREGQGRNLLEWY